MNRKQSIFNFEDFSFGRKFGMIGKLYQAQLALRLKHLGIERQFSVLVLISKMGDRCCQKLVGEMLHIDKTIMVGVIDDLAEKGFIKRVKNPADRREYWIRLTQRGKKSMPEIMSVVNHLNKSIMKGLSKTEVSRLHRQLEIIVANLEEIGLNSRTLL